MNFNSIYYYSRLPIIIARRYIIYGDSATNWLSILLKKLMETSVRVPRERCAKFLYFYWVVDDDDDLVDVFSICWNVSKNFYADFLHFDTLLEININFRLLITNDISGQMKTQHNISKLNIEISISILGERAHTRIVDNLTSSVQNRFLFATIDMPSMAHVHCEYEKIITLSSGILMKKRSFLTI